MPTFEHEGIHFNYVTLGEGVPLVLNHGLGGDHTQPKDLLSELPGYRTVYWDCRGHGETEPVGPREGFHFSQFSKDLEALMDGLGIEKAVVGGISMGAALSTRFVLDHPERVLALILIRPAWLAETNPPNLEMARKIAALLESKGVERALEDAEFFSLVPENLHKNLRDQILKPQAFERRFRLEGMPSSAPTLDWGEVQSIQCPTLVIGNDNDPVHPLEYATTWAEKIQPARFVQVISKNDDFELHEEEVRQEIIRFIGENPIS